MNPWLQIDLGSTQLIGEIDYWRRTDCCADRSDNLLLSVMDASGIVVWSYQVEGTPENPLLLPLAPAVSGKTVRVERLFEDPILGYLNIAEVQVFTAGPPLLSVGRFGGDILIACPDGPERMGIWLGRG